jgi:hypothetical protein
MWCPRNKSSSGRHITKLGYYPENDEKSPLTPLFLRGEQESRLFYYQQVAKKASPFEKGGMRGIFLQRLGTNYNVFDCKIMWT